MKVLADTSALYALLDADDRNHLRARTCWISWMENPIDLVCSNYILVESMALLQRRLGMLASRQFQQAIVPLLEVRWVDPQIHSSAVSALFAADRRDLSLVDCTSFEIMRRLGLSAAFAFDPHFTQQGFETLP